MSDTQQMPTTTPDAITAAASASFEECTEPRLREIMQALVRHVHGFISDVHLTPAEWSAGIEPLTPTGKVTDEHRQEFILWSDTLGASMLVDALDNPLPPGATDWTGLGPFSVRGSPPREFVANTPEENGPGIPALVHGHVGSMTGEPIAG